MVQIVENWSELCGRVESLTGAAEGASEGARLEVTVLFVAPVAGYPNMLADVLGRRIALRAAAAEFEPQVGDLVRCRVRKAGLDRYFCAPGTLAVVERRST